MITFQRLQLRDWLEELRSAKPAKGSKLEGGGQWGSIHNRVDLFSKPGGIDVQSSFERHALSTYLLWLDNGSNLRILLRDSRESGVIVTISASQYSKDLVSDVEGIRNSEDLVKVLFDHMIVGTDFTGTEQEFVEYIHGLEGEGRSNYSGLINVDETTTDLENLVIATILNAMLWARTQN